MMADLTAWQHRALATSYLILYMDALQVKIREGAHVEIVPSTLPLDVTLDANKDALGIFSRINIGRESAAKYPHKRCVAA
jgi:putative transposase